MTSANYSRRCLMSELSELTLQPLEGFQMMEVEEEDITKWSVTVMGPPESLYEGGCFELKLKFPQDYPFSPPSVWFNSEIWHPNVYESGEVCLSTLTREQHMAPGVDRDEHWKAGHRVRTVLLSVQCLLSEPNANSAANIDAGKQYRDWKNNGNPVFLKIVKQCVKESRVEASKKGVAVPPLPPTEGKGMQMDCSLFKERLTLMDKEELQQDDSASDSDDTDPLDDPTPPGSPLAS